MAERPYFLVENNTVQKRNAAFTWYPGFAPSQKRKSIASMHTAMKQENPHLYPLEISTKSEDPFGVSLSAFRLKLDGSWLENVFQSSKVFSGGGPYTDLKNMDPKEAKKDPRLKNSGELTGFVYESRTFDLLPRTAFYDYLYLRAVLYTGIEINPLAGYNGFTDIEFNPARSFNTQARSAAILKLLVMQKADLSELSRNPEEFIVWHRQHVQG